MFVKNSSIYLAVVLAVFLLLIPSVAAQTTLTVNEPLENEFILGNSSDFYEANSYQISRDAGSWTVAIVSPINLILKVTVASDSTMVNVIAEISSEVSEYLLLSFDLSSDTTVYILVEEDSPNGDKTGMYTIGVYDDAHLASVTQYT